jgi:hypothetical protein
VPGRRNHCRLPCYYGAPPRMREAASEPRSNSISETLSVRSGLAAINQMSTSDCPPLPVQQKLRNHPSRQLILWTRKASSILFFCNKTDFTPLHTAVRPLDLIMYSTANSKGNADKRSSRCT